MKRQSPPAIARLNQRIVRCRCCPRLVAWREQVACDKKRAYRDWDYWGRPVPSFGDPNARVLVVGLAPAAHGANRTGRMFTGDQSGRWLYRALHRAGLATQPTWERANDGLELRDCYITAAIHCAPPANKPAREELAACAGFLDAELAALARLRVVVALGKIAFDTVLRALERGGGALPRPRPRFAHGARFEIPAGRAAGRPLTLIGSYHPSQQNTNTGKLTEPMLDTVLASACRYAVPGGSPA